MADHADSAIHGSKTKREPRFTPRIFPKAGILRRAVGCFASELKRETPSAERRSFSPPGIQALAELARKAVKSVERCIMKDGKR